MDKQPISSDRLICFVDKEGNSVGEIASVPIGIEREQLLKILNTFVKNESETLYSLTLENGQIEIGSTLCQALDKVYQKSSESILYIYFHPIKHSNVRPIGRCHASMPGHTEAVLALHFNTTGSRLASASGDGTVRIWDTYTATPVATCVGHRNWVLEVQWSPDGTKVVSGGMDGAVITWDPDTGRLLSQHNTGNMKNHAITAIIWQPCHLGPDRCRYLCYGTRSGGIAVIDSIGENSTRMSGHQSGVTALRWTGVDGEGIIVSGSRDTLIRVWDASNGSIIQELRGHGHRVNALSLNTDFVMRCLWNKAHSKNNGDNWKEMATQIRNRSVDELGGEKLASVSDDGTCAIWNLTTNKEWQLLFKCTGAREPVNHVLFSPDGKYIAGASFDKSICLWDARTGNLLSSFRGHIAPAYRIAFSPNSLILVSASEDSTIKQWSVIGKKSSIELPGHRDAVYALDFTVDGTKLASGSKDRTVRIWTH